MPKVTKTLGNNKVRACESPDFAHNKEDVSVLTHPLCYPLLYHTVLPASWAAARHTTATETTATDCGHDAARSEGPHLRTA